MISKSVIEAKFKRSEIKIKDTFLWKEMPSDLLKAIEPKLLLQEDEKPIICFCSSLDYVLVLSDLRLIFLKGDSYNAYNYSSIKKVSLDDLFDGTADKMEKRNLWLELSDGGRIEVEVEQGTWSIMYNILKLLVSASKDSM